MMNPCVPIPLKAKGGGKRQHLKYNQLSKKTQKFPCGQQDVYLHQTNYSTFRHMSLHVSVQLKT